MNTKPVLMHAYNVQLCVIIAQAGAHRKKTLMARCIELDMQCSAVCYASAQLMSLGSGKAMELCKICGELCEECGNECSKHQTKHCQECARACKQCAEECRKMAA
jgi:hypothetical protein